MKNKSKGFTLMEVIMVMSIMTAIIYGMFAMYASTQNSLIAREKMFVKKMMIAGGDPHRLAPNISSIRIDQYIKEIVKENEIATAKGTEKLISQEITVPTPDDYQVSQNQVYTPTVIVKNETPEIKQVTENHYHFEALITLSKYIGAGILSIFALFCSIKALTSMKKAWTVRSATKESEKILHKFDNEFEDNKNYLAFIRKISDQVIVNSVLIDNRKNKETVLKLIVTNENLKDKLSFLESNFVKIMN